MDQPSPVPNVRQPLPRRVRPRQMSLGCPIAGRVRAKKQAPSCDRSQGGATVAERLARHEQRQPQIRESALDGQSQSQNLSKDFPEVGVGSKLIRCWARDSREP